MIFKHYQIRKMPSSQIIKFQMEKGQEPKFSTAEYWQKFSYFIIGKTKMMPDKIIEKERASVTEEQTLNRDICKRAFLEAIGDHAIAEIQLKYPKEEIYQQNLGWLKEKWEECYQPDRNVTEKLIEAWNGHRDKKTDILQHWLKVAERVAKCQIDKMEAKKIEEELQIAIYLNTVRCPESAKSMWEKRANKDELEKLVKAVVAAEKEMQRVSKTKQSEPKETQIKEEPVGKINKKKGKRVSEAEKKERHCFKCGEAGWKPEHNKVFRARKHVCKVCKKLGHLEKVCRKAKEKVNKIEAENDNSIDSNSSTEPESTKTESVGKIREVSCPKWETLPIRRVRQKRQRLERTGNEFEFTIRLNGVKMRAILDTGSPITILPKRLTKAIRPKRVIRQETSRKFVDVNG